MHMVKSLEKTEAHLERLKKKNPAYSELIDFYGKIAGELCIAKPQIPTTPIHPNEEVRKIRTKEGFPLVNKKAFLLDIPASITLFQSIANIAKETTSKLKKNVQKIEMADKHGKLNREELLKNHFDSTYLDEITRLLHLDRSILYFLIHTSLKPSIHANVENLRNQVDLKNWQRGYCPICGSLPQMSELKGEGQRYFQCSFCDFQWASERLKCPFCENKDHEKLHYFYAEGQEVHRVDLCDTCKRYIKTVDSRNIGYEPDLNLEDMITIHLDILASKKGFQRPVPNIWGA